MNIFCLYDKYRLCLSTNLLMCIFFMFCFSCGSENLETITKSAHSSLDKKTVKKIFTQISNTESNINFKNTLIDDPLDPNHNVMDFPHYFNGAGTAVADFDNDGLSDIFFVGNEVENRVYKNLGDFKFEDKTKTANVNDKKGWSNGVTIVDINNDGFQDIYVCQTSTQLVYATSAPNVLYINNGDFTFTEAAAEYGLDSKDLSHQASFFDYDQDGDLDCFILNTSIYVSIHIKLVYDHLNKDKKNLEAASSKLYENRNGKYVDVTERAGLLQLGFGLGLMISDLNDDGLSDIYVANDYYVPDFMYINNGDGTFTDKIKEKTNQISFFAMGTDIADINNDGLLDIGVADMASQDHVRGKTLMQSMDIPSFNVYVDLMKFQHQYMFNSMQLNNGNGTFSNISNLAGVAKTDWSWALLLADFDNDGYKDYFVTNGRRRYSGDNDTRIKLEEYIANSTDNSVPKELRKQLYDDLPSVKLKNIMLKNNQDMTFTDTYEAWGLGQATFSNGASYADLDNDGDLDLVISNLDDFASVYRNDSSNNFLSIHLAPNDEVKNIENTKVVIKYDDQIQVAEYTPTRGFLSTVETKKLNFGLGKVNKVDYLQVNWPNGQVNYLTNVKVNQQLKLSPSMKNTGRRQNVMEKSSPLYADISEGVNLNFNHEENDFNDFDKEVLLPHKQSALGSKISVADVNGDGLDDVFLGNAKDKASALYIQTKSEGFRISGGATFAKDKAHEDLNSHFFDYDGDGDQDLYVCSGGGGDFSPAANLLQDRLYENDGKGNFKRTYNILPVMLSTSSTAASYDYDQDGDLDLFVGGRGIPGKYPFPDRSYMLRNEGGKFIDATEELNQELLKPGLVTEAIWSDMTGDGISDLILVGEWMNPKVFKNDKGTFEDISKGIALDEYKGWWYSVAAVDIDKDGDMDLICGNNSPNTKFKASKKKPFNVFADDFDGNGSCDIVLSKEYKGELVPTRGKECSTEQMPFIKDKFPTYNSFANATLNDILGEKINSALHLEVTTFHSMVFLNEGGKMVAKQLPSAAQIAPINGIVTTDVNEDGNIDLIVAGNNFDTEVETARYDAGTGLILLGNGMGDFNSVSIVESGIFANKNAKDIKQIKDADGNSVILVLNNNGPLQVFKKKFEDSKQIGFVE